MIKDKKAEGIKKSEKAAGWRAAGLSVVGRRRVAMGGRVGLGDREAEEHSLLQGLHSHFLILQLLLHLGQLLLQSGELRTQVGTGLAWHTMAFSQHHHQPKLLSHEYSRTGMLSYVYTEVHACVCSVLVHIHTQSKILK